MVWRNCSTQHFLFIPTHLFLNGNTGNALVEQLLKEDLGGADTYILHNDDVIRRLEVVQLVRNQDSRGVAQVAADALVEQLPAHVRIHC